MKRKRYSVLAVLAVVFLLAGGIWMYLRGPGGQNKCFFGESEYASVFQWNGII